ncbi:hypothetical protein [Nostoc sp.]|uniref:hypothetical protein n=1 Tax=Nostoc sp. TaxID=1180 RepID=UPI002FF95E5C
MIIGFNPGIKQEINIGKRNNQMAVATTFEEYATCSLNFVEIPHLLLKLKLQALCKRYGLQEGIL